jgi:hypothetical protein
MLLAGGTGDEQRALKLLADARTNYRNLGMHSYATRTSVVHAVPGGRAPA